MWEISLRVSAVPSILRDSVGTQVLSQVRELIDTKFAEVKNTTEAKIDAAESDAYAKLAAGRAQALGQVDAITQAKLSEIAASNPALAQAIQYQNQSPTAKAAVDQVTGQIRAGVLQKIDEEVGKNRTIIEQTIAGVRQGAKTQLQDAYRTVLAEQTRRIDKRLNDIERDTTVPGARAQIRVQGRCQPCRLPPGRKNHAGTWALIRRRTSQLYRESSSRS